MNMKSTIKNLVWSGLASFAILGGAVSAFSQTTLTIDSKQPWIGYMAWSPVPGDAPGYGGSGSSSWGTGALIAYFDVTGTNSLTLMPNTNTYAPGTPYWVNADGSGANNMDASFYVQNDALEGQVLVFNGNCVSNSLVSPYTSVAFIKEFDNSYNIVNEDETTPVAGQPFSLFLVTGTGTHVQYGFETVGPDANPNTVAALGQVVYQEDSADPEVSKVTSQAVVQGQSATFSVTASGTAPFSYQWEQIVGTTTNVLSNGGQYTGATSNVLTIANVTTANVGTYSVTVNNSIGSGTASASLVVVSLAQAKTNLLIDPSFESGVFDSTGVAGWSDFSGSDFVSTNNFYYNSDIPVTVVDGTNCVQVYAAGTYNGFYQDKPALPGQVYTANVWFLTPSVDEISGGNNCFLEVQFRDTNGNILVDDESATVNTNTPTDTWISFSPTAKLVSPAGTVSVRFQVTYFNAGFGGSVYVDDADLRLRAPATKPTLSGSNIQLTFPTVAGPTYQVLYKANLTDPSWTLLTSVTGDGNVHTVSDPSNTAGRFYVVNTQ
jgi:hypothetical protein